MNRYRYVDDHKGGGKQEMNQGDSERMSTVEEKQFLKEGVIKKEVIVTGEPIPKMGFLGGVLKNRSREKTDSTCMSSTSSEHKQSREEVRFAGCDMVLSNFHVIY